MALLLLELSKILKCKFGHNYVKQRYNEKAKLCYMDMNSFIVYIRADDIFKDIVGDVEIRFDTSNQMDYCIKKKLKKNNWINEWLIRRKSNDKIY